MGKEAGEIHIPPIPPLERQITLKFNDNREKIIVSKSSIPYNQECSRCNKKFDHTAVVCLPGKFYHWNCYALLATP
jgi:hypothetical protein